MTTKAKQNEKRPAQAQPGEAKLCGPTLNVTAFGGSGLEDIWRRLSGTASTPLKRGHLCLQRFIFKNQKDILANIWCFELIMPYERLKSLEALERHIKHRLLKFPCCGGSHSKNLCISITTSMI
jgi:hypothetical protein